MLLLLLLSRAALPSKGKPAHDRDACQLTVKACLRRNSAIVTPQPPLGHSGERRSYCPAQLRAPPTSITRPGESLGQALLHGRGRKPERCAPGA